MSNEYKDWERDRIEEERQAVSEYPFLRIRDIDGTPDIEAKFPMIGLEIPNGWYKLFFQMCEDIKPLLEEEGLLDDFYFIQVKEKYNYLRCYSNGKASKKVEDIIAKYEQMAPYICTLCGKPATRETTGYIASFCDDCFKANFKHEKAEWLIFKPFFAVTTFGENGRSIQEISFEEEWNKYLKLWNN
jgi:hypothetical protein